MLKNPVFLRFFGNFLFPIISVKTNLVQSNSSKNHRSRSRIDMRIRLYISSPTAAFSSASNLLVSAIFCGKVFSLLPVSFDADWTNRFFAAEIFWIFCLLSLSSILLSFFPSFLRLFNTSSRRITHYLFRYIDAFS